MCRTQHVVAQLVGGGSNYTLSHCIDFLLSKRLNRDKKLFLFSLVFFSFWFAILHHQWWIQNFNSGGASSRGRAFNLQFWMKTALRQIYYYSFYHVSALTSVKFSIIQWRIQDFPEGSAPTPKLGLFCKFFSASCMKMKEFGPRGSSVTPPLDPPMI